jgi:hypothetical protein
LKVKPQWSPCSGMEDIFKFRINCWQTPAGVREMVKTVDGTVQNNLNINHEAATIKRQGAKAPTII